MMLMRLFLSVLVISALHSPLAAADIVDKGFYLGFNAGYAAGKLKADDPSVGNIDLRGGYTSNLYFGYNVVPFAGFEAGVGYLGGLKLSGSDDSAKLSGPLARAGISLWGDLTNNLGIYNKFGYMFNQLGFDEDGSEDFDFNGFYYELGLMFALTKNMALTTSGAYMKGTANADSDIDMSLFQGLVGLQFQF
ncbi:Uncharacterised protein [BD1-7 clade bacterium]|uniref:Outer membrane protein beta-barrel domain-containing protein n=1 Tax=BD1-7 clade bacterium TaxID=2029982 RepID=A0A5S9PLC3_9GAMM|nr:Uncharacterised protein [BD1-7 clade bacterium]CAA0104903.1 Uncharacterised protein [BD1-7 clade bacterium]CAA0125681.1 Uncharacterised protein [BD1-7 clade bacterium]